MLITINYKKAIQVFMIFILTIPIVIFIASYAIAFNQQDFNDWLYNFKKEALKIGISQQTLNSAFKGIKPNKKVIELDRNQPEFKLSLSDYLNLIVTESKINKGREKLYNNQQLLQKIQNIYKIPPRLLVALWGIETDYGRITGDFNIFEALVTLAYDSRRSKFFRKELLHALYIIDNGYISLDEMNGSWAGAMGYLQFLPSTTRFFAVDYDKDGTLNIWKEHGDLFASGANYLSSSGWVANQTWGHEIMLPKCFDYTFIDAGNRKDISKWQAMGVRLLNGVNLPDKDLPASVIQPDKSVKRFFLVYNNFHVLMKWNHSYHFAIAVGTLSDQIGNIK